MQNRGLTKAGKPECCVLFRRETESCSFTIDRTDRLKKGSHLRPGGGATWMTQRQLRLWAISSLAQARTHESFSTELSWAPVNRSSLCSLAPIPWPHAAEQKEWHSGEGVGDPLPTPSMRDSKHDPYHGLRASNHTLSGLFTGMIVGYCMS